MENLTSKNLTKSADCSFAEQNAPVTQKSAEATSDTKPDTQPNTRLEIFHSSRSNHSAGAISESLNVAEPTVLIDVPSELPPLGSGPKRDTMMLLGALAGRKCQPADLLEPLLACTCTTHPAMRAAYRQEAGRELDRQMRNLGYFARRRVRARLQSGQIEALRIALREGAGNIETDKRALLNDLNSQIDAQFGQLHEKFGCKPAKPPSKKETARARMLLDKFNNKLDQNCYVRKGSLAAAEVMQLMFNPNFSYGDMVQKYEQFPQHDIYPQVSKQFLIDTPRTKYVLEHADGSKEALVDSRDLQQLNVELGNLHFTGKSSEFDKILAKLQKFCGDKTLPVSRVAQQYCLTDLTLPLLQIPLDLPLPAEIATDDMRIFRQRSVGQHICVIKDQGDGSFTVKYSIRQVNFAIFRNQKNLPLNPNLSHWNIDGEMTVGNDGKLGWAGLTYDFAAVPLMSTAADVVVIPEMYLNGSPAYQQAVAEIDRERSGLFMQQDNYKLDGEETSQANLIGKDLITQIKTVGRTDKTWAANYVRELRERKVLSHKQADELRRRMKFLSEAFSTLEDMPSTEAAALATTVAKAGQLAGDLRLLQQDLIAKANLWSGKMHAQDAAATTVLAAGLAAACESVVDEVATLAADYCAALEDFRGGVNVAATGSKLARVETARMQCAAVREALQQAQGENTGTEDDDQIIGELIEQIRNREERLQENLFACNEQATKPLTLGPGALGTALANGRREILQTLQDAGELPATHPQLSEAQLLGLQIEHFAESNLNSAKILGSFAQKRSAAFGEQLSSGPWAPIRNSFQDVGALGRLRNVTSTITPAPRFAEPAFAHSYSERGVPSSARMQGAHVCNLAHTSLANEKQEILFAGLRHGVLDAYDVTEEKLAQAPQIKEKLVALAAEQRGTQGTAEAAELNAVNLRAVANANMARELVHAAVAGDPLLLKRARTGKSVKVRMDSMSLSAPEIRRPFTGSERQMLANQALALESLASPVEITVADKNGNPKTVNVDVDPVRKFNFAVGESGTSGKIRRKLGKFLSWRRADRMNEEPLREMLGPRESATLGGEAGRVLKFLDDEADHGLDEQQQEALRTTGGLPSAFANPGKRAAAIRELGAQIKRISAQGSHHSSGNEPYQLAARVALLSNLLGRTTAFNCKSGSDRTSQLDEAVKQLAADVEAERTPRPGAAPDLLRRTNYALRSGNLELQQYNTGLRGHLLLGERNLRSQFSSQLAEDLFRGDARNMHSG